MIPPRPTPTPREWMFAAALCEVDIKFEVFTCSKLGLTFRVFPKVARGLPPSSLLSWLRFDLLVDRGIFSEYS